MSIYAYICVWLCICDLYLHVPMFAHVYDYRLVYVHICISVCVYRSAHGF